MLLPVKWLKEYVDIDIDSRELADKLTLSGSHVESIIKLDKGIKKVVVGKILKIEKHPNADRLVITTTDVGDEKLQIVTGASNIKEGDYVPVALVGSRLPGGIKIKKGKLRGVESYGMLCSISELGVEESIVPKKQKNGIFIFDKPYLLGTDIKKIFGFNGEVIEFEITPNRPDCLSILGMARETVATLNKKLRYPSINIENEVDNIDNYLKGVQILDKDLCKRYYARVIKDINIKQSPLWLQTRLMEAGIRPINNIVDVTNYVMLEYGQPLHAFDLDKVVGRKVYVRKAVDNENIITLDEIERQLNCSDLIIADGEKPIAIAGIMGGNKTEINSETKTILIESANFDDKSVRLTSKRFGLRTEASSRFEKGIDANLCKDACDRVCQLIEQINGGAVVKGCMDLYDEKVEEKSIKLRPERVNRLLGTEISKEKMVNILKNLEFRIIDKDDFMEVKVPTFRLDLESEVDLIEEIGRLYGFHNISNKPLKGVLTKAEKPLEKKIEDKVKNILLALGINEITTYSFISPKAYDKIKLPNNSVKRNYVNIMNPLGEDYSVMRTTLIPNIMEVLGRNFNYGVEKASVYEIGNIFIPKQLPVKDLPYENKNLCIGIYGNVDFFDLKGKVEVLLNRLGINNCEYLREENHMTFHPGRTANIICQNKVIGLLGEIHPDVLFNYNIKQRVYVAEFNFEAILEMTLLQRKYKPLPKYPAITRDIAMVLSKDILVKDIEKVIWQEGGKLVDEVKLFDVYSGNQIAEGNKSVAFSVIYRSYKRTLKDEEVAEINEKIIQQLEKKFDAKLRS